MFSSFLCPWFDEIFRFMENTCNAKSFREQVWKVRFMIKIGLHSTLSGAVEPVDSFNF